MSSAEPGRERVRRLVRRAGVARAVKAAVRRFGFDLVRRHYYSPVPDLAALPPSVWGHESPLSGVELNIEAGLELIERELAPYIEQYSPPARPDGDPRSFYLHNAFYESVDAETLYAMVRHLMPARIVELGSGMSTLVIADARADGSETAAAAHRVYDPFPRDDLAPTLSEIADLSRAPATEVPMTVFDELQSGDILFVDTTHTVKVGSDVNRIVLEVLPRLSAGVYVHIHDIFLPGEYPREFFEERSFYWAEQYLLQAFLAFNREFEVVLANSAIQRRYPDRLVRLVPSADPGIQPSAFWLRRAGR